VAKAVEAGSADAGIGIAASAGELGLGFIPLFEEPYEIAAPLHLVGDERIAPLFDVLSSGDFRAAVRKLDGYVVSGNAGNVDVVR
jgi:putative molybdopterin biosynthesis protein